MDLTRTYAEGDTLKDPNGHDFKLFGLDYTELVYVAARGKTFTMGDNNSGYENEAQITFDRDYFIGRFAVTQALYEKVTGHNPSRFKGNSRPVEMVSWDDVTDDFLPKLNKQLQETYPNFNGRFALPSEAQWEYAAAGGEAWNSPKLEYAGSNNLHDVGWFRDNTDQTTTFPVGLKEPNALSLYDMSGNVWEWCQDDYEANLAELPKNGMPTPNQKGSSKVLRGGSYFHFRIYCRVRNRFNFTPDNRYRDNGFRLVFPPFRPKRIYEA